MKFDWKNKNMFWTFVLLQIVILFVIIIRYSYVLLTGDEYFVLAKPVDPMDHFRGQYVSLAYNISDYSATGSLLSGLNIGDNLYVVPNISDKKIIESISNISKDKPTDGLFLNGKVSSISISKNYKVKLVDGRIMDYNYIDYVWNSYGKTSGSYSSGDLVKVMLDSDFSGNQLDRISYIYPFDTTVSYGQLFDAKIISTEFFSGDIRIDYGVDRFFVKEGKGKEIEDAVRKDSAYGIWKVSKGGKILIDGMVVDGNIVR